MAGSPYRAFVLRSSSCTHINVVHHEERTQRHLFLAFSNAFVFHVCVVILSGHEWQNQCRAKCPRYFVKLSSSSWKATAWCPVETNKCERTGELFFIGIISIVHSSP